MKDKITVYLFLGYIFIFSICNVLIPDEEISTSERRRLNEFPKFELTNEYISKLEDYLLDHFPLRDNFRSIKAKFNYKLLNKLDNNNIYLKDNYIFKSNYPTNKESINNFINIIESLKGHLTENNKTYLMIVPDKNYYLNDKNFLQIDYDYIYKELEKLDMEMIDIRKELSIDDYYETDTHWKQERLNKVVKAMSKTMDFEYEEIKYKENKYNNFYGVYYGESALNRKPETLTYLTNDLLDEVEVKYFENKDLNKIYNINNLTNFDSYDVYLDGPSSFIEIFNDKSKSNKELVIFRDSFGSSLSPLLVNYYKKITIIDNRYFRSDFLKDVIEFKDQDILFMYSTLLINDSYSLKG